MMTASNDSQADTGAWASLILRLAMASLFFVAAVGKLKDGMTSVEATVGYFQKTFESTWLPKPMVTMHAYATPFVEALIAVWLLTGFKIRAGWIFTGLFLVSLAFGMAVAGNHQIAGQNYMYVLMASLGLYFSRFDRFNVSCCMK